MHFATSKTKDSGGNSDEFTADELSYSEVETILQSLAQPRGETQLHSETNSPPRNTSKGKLSPKLELKSPEVRYRVLVEQIPAITFMAALTGDTSEMYVSPQIEGILGYSPREWLDDPLLWYSRLHPDDRGRWDTEFARTCGTGKAFKAQYRFLARDGHVVWVQGEAKIICDQQGLPLFIQGVAFDITQQKLAEEALRKNQADLEKLVRNRTSELSEAVESLQSEISDRQRAEEALRDREIRLRSVVDTAIDGIVVIDDFGVVESLNPAAEKLFGYLAEEAVGRNVQLLMPSPFREEHDSYLHRYRTTRIPNIIGTGRELVGQRKDGSTFIMELSVSEMQIGEDIKFTGLVRDISHRKKTEQHLAEMGEQMIRFEAANQAKNEFLSRMSHELRTPLNSILGFSQLLEMNELPDEDRECVEQINRGGKHLLKLINEVLDISRIESGNLTLSPEAVDIVEVIRDSTNLIRPLANQRGIQILLNESTPKYLYVKADIQRLHQVILNLLSNAVKYNCDFGKVHLTVEEAPSGRVRLAIRDTGVGIASEKMSRLFLPFDRMGAEQMGTEGVGLGLALSKGLVELMRGSLTAASVEGEGSCFYLELDQASIPSVTAGDETDLYDVFVDPISEYTILYVEDNVDNVRLVRQILKHRPSLRLLTAMQGSIGLDLAQQHHPKVILLDLHLPDIPGEEVLRRLKTMPETTSIPVIVLSADATQRQQQQLRRAGAWDYLTKPIHVRQFLSILEKAIQVGETEQ